MCSSRGLFRKDSAKPRLIHRTVRCRADGLLRYCEAPGLNARTPHANQLIATLPAAERTALLAACETHDLTLSQVLGEPQDRIAYAYFPTTGFVSLIARVDQDAIEVNMVGSEGMVGLPLALGVATTTLYTVVQGAGTTLRIAAEAFRAQLARSPGLQRSLSCYAAVMLAQLAQTGACTRFHHVEERVARWLAMTRDRAGASDFHLTHEFLSAMLGVRRVGITGAAQALQRRGLISYRRGNVHVADRAGLQAAACSCYRLDREMYAKLMEECRAAGDS